MNEVIRGFVDSFVKKYRGDFKLWHFLRQTSPVTGEPEIRLRFFGEDDKIKNIRTSLVNELTQLERNDPTLYASHAFGNHGIPSQDYLGEEGAFGKKGWPIFAEFLMKTSETAIAFLRDQPLGNSEKPWIHYVERFSHCFWNQLGVPPYLKFRSVGPEILGDGFQWLDVITQMVKLPL